MYRAAAALPFTDREAAIVGLQGQLTVMAAAAGASPDWSTLSVEGPTVPHASGLSEWAATVIIAAATYDLSDGLIDSLVGSAPQLKTPVEDTAPLHLAS
jgi:hypothetical protein